MNALEPSVVIVEDDANIAGLIELYLGGAGFRVSIADRGEKALDLIRARPPSIVVLDVGLAGEIDGYEVCRTLRKTSEVPIVMLTARDGEQDRIRGFESGADDYVVKPFSPRELVVRVEAILRRSDPNRSRRTTHSAGGVEIDLDARETRTEGTPVALAAREFDLLAFLVAHQGNVLTRQQLLDGVWGEGWVGDPRTVDVHVRQLRKKLGDPLPLATVWGVGYRLD